MQLPQCQNGGKQLSVSHRVIIFNAITHENGYKFSDIKHKILCASFMQHIYYEIRFIPHRHRERIYRNKKPASHCETEFY
jgi:hypothetical protein